MTRLIKIDRGIYLVEDETKTYWHAARNLHWLKNCPEENEKNKKLIEDYTRVYINERKKTYPAESTGVTINASGNK